MALAVPIVVRIFYFAVAEPIFYLTVAEPMAVPMAEPMAEPMAVPMAVPIFYFALAVPMALFFL